MFTRVKGEVKGNFFLMIRQPPRSTRSRSAAASDVYKRQAKDKGKPVRAPIDVENILEGYFKLDLVYIDLPDFAFVRLSPVSALLNGGFARAYHVKPEDL